MSQTPTLLNLTMPSVLFNTSDAANLAAALRDYLAIDEPKYRFNKSLEPVAAPSLIELIGAAPVWLALSAAATAYLATIGKRAADATWDYIARAQQDRKVKPLADVASALADAARRAGPETQVIVGLDIPERNWGTALAIPDQDPAMIAHRVAIFVANAERISTLMKAEIAAGRSPVGRAQITIEGDGIVVHWMWMDQHGAHEGRIDLSPE